MLVYAELELLGAHTKYEVVLKRIYFFCARTFYADTFYVVVFAQHIVALKEHLEEVATQILCHNMQVFQLARCIFKTQPHYYSFLSLFINTVIFCLT